MFYIMLSVPSGQQLQSNLLFFIETADVAFVYHNNASIQMQYGNKKTNIEICEVPFFSFDKTQELTATT